jgi:hypothetical protein
MGAVDASRRYAAYGLDKRLRATSGRDRASRPVHLQYQLD